MEPNRVPKFTEDELHEYITLDLGAEHVSRRSIKHAVMNREIIPTRIGNHNLFCADDAHAWLESRKQPEPGRRVRDRKTVAAQ